LFRRSKRFLRPISWAFIDVEWPVYPASDVSVCLTSGAGISFLSVAGGRPKVCPSRFVCTQLHHGSKLEIQNKIPIATKNSTRPRHDTMHSTSCRGGLAHYPCVILFSGSNVFSSGRNEAKDDVNSTKNDLLSTSGVLQDKASLRPVRN